MHESGRVKVPCTLLFFIGGVTSAEVAAIRLLSKLSGRGTNWDIIVATTKVIAGDELMEAVTEKMNT